MTIYNRNPSASATINMTRTLLSLADGNRHHNLLLPRHATTHNYIYFPNKGNCLQSAHTTPTETSSHNVHLRQ